MRGGERFFWYGVEGGGWDVGGGGADGDRDRGEMGGEMGEEVE